MDIIPTVQISEPGVRAPSRTFANVDAPMRISRKESLLTEITYKGQLHQLRIWSSRKRGAGALGVVFEADMVSADGHSEAVVARSFCSLFSERSMMLLVREISAWQLLDHPRILPFYGISAQFGIQQVAIVSPRAPNGNMKEFIMKNPTKDRRRLVEHVAEGLNYLHVSVGMVHGDLKCTNVVISADGSAQLADSGLSTLVERTEIPSATGIRIRNMAPFAAPELLSERVLRRAAQDATPGVKPSKTTQTDVFAFGSLIYEAYSGAEPWPSSDEEIPPRSIGTPLAIPLTDNLWNLCLTCWARDRYKRPDSSEILLALTDLAPSPTAAGGDVI